jgi:DNA polymerase-3 subunit gamma/tau
LQSMTQHMATICQKENFMISDESLALIAREATGSMRDALSLLDQVISCFNAAVSHDQVLEILGVIDRKVVFDLCDGILGNDILSILNTLDDIYNSGHDLKRLYSNLLEHLRNLLVLKMGQNITKLVDLPDYELDQMVEQTKPVSAAGLNQIFDFLFREEASIRLSATPKLALEMAFIRLHQLKPALPIDILIDKLDDLKQEIFSPLSNTLSDRKTELDNHTNAAEQKTLALNSDLQASQDLSRSDAPQFNPESQKNLDKTWSQLHEIISRKNPSLAANLAKCQLKQITPDRVEIEVRGNGFTLNMLQRAKNMAVLKQICAEHFGTEKKIILSTKPEPDDQSPKKKSQNDNLLKQKALSHPLVAEAIEIFNGKLIDVKIL